MKNTVTVSSWNRILHASPFSTLLKILLTIDLCFILLHLVFTFTPLLDDMRFSIDRQRGFADIFQYLKTTAIIVGFLLVFLRTRSFGFFAWSLLFLFVLFGDVFRIHEIGGSFLSDQFHLPSLFGIIPEDLGVLMVYGLVGTSIFSILIWHHFKGSEPFKRASVDLALIFIAFSFFGVFLDIIHQFFKANFVYGIITIVEDGGEMIIISLFLAYLYFVSLRTRPEASFEEIRPGKLSPKVT